MTEIRSISLRFQGATVSLDEIRTELSSALTELSDPHSGLALEASKAGFDPGEFVGAQASVKEEAKGFGVVVILIAILAPAVTHALDQVWDDLIWPRIKSRLGHDALGELEKAPREPEKSDE